MLGNPWIEVSCVVFMLHTVATYIKHDYIKSNFIKHYYKTAVYFRRRPVMHWNCPSALRFCRSFWSTFTQMSVPPLKVSFILFIFNRRFLFPSLLVVSFLCPTECLKVEFVCSVLVVADQLLITRLKEMCEVVITEHCKFICSLWLYFGHYYFCLVQVLK